jgi:hypothetical protein
MPSIHRARRGFIYPRRFSSLTFLVAAAVTVLAVAGQANAAISYTYTTELGPNGSLFLNPGESKTLKLYLRETLTAGSTSLLGTAAAPGVENGLFSGSVRITRTAGTTISLGAVTLNTVDWTGPTSSTTSATEAKLSEAIGNSDTHGVYLGNTGGVPANGLGNSVYLGTVVVTAGAGSGVNTFTVLRYDPIRLGNTVTYTNFLDMDVDSNANPAYTGTANAASISFESFTVLVNEPEPSCAAIATVFGAAATLIRRRRSA